MEYKVVTARYNFDSLAIESVATLQDAAEKFSKEVERWIADGWIPLGGVSVPDTKLYHCQFAQAMIRN